MTDKAMGIAVAVNFFTAFVVVITLPFIISYIGIEFAFWLYGIFSIVGALWCWFGMFETKGMTKEEILDKITN